MADVSKIKVVDAEYDIKDATAVKYTEQELTEEQKTIARENIGASKEITWKRM